MSAQLSSVFSIESNQTVGLELAVPTGDTTPVPDPTPITPATPATDLLRSLVLKAAREHLDPWAKFNIHEIPAERVYRHRYLPKTGTWTIDESIVKIQTTPFDSGAMRNTYRMKKLSQAQLGRFQKVNWHHAPNYVAKAYKNQTNSWDPNDRDKVFSDVRLQYEADFWATKFNSYHPPKAVHFIQCFAIEFFQRPGCPVLGCERFIDGHDEFGAGFVKHNSNSGFVEQREGRMTPQTFSAFTFYESQGTIMVVDIQGVNDLYTDPQVHSLTAKFGDADLSVRGMAMFFATFERNPLCEFFHLPRFKLSRKQSIKARTNRAALYAHTPHLQDALVSAHTECNINSDQEEIAYAIQLAASQARLEINKFTELNRENSPCTITSSRDELTKNTARVHVELCLLHFQGRLSSQGEVRFLLDGDVEASTDYASCLFHLAQASCLGYPAAALALGRLCQGLSTVFCDGLESIMTEDKELSMLFYELASYRGSATASWALGSMYLQIGDSQNALKFIRRTMELMKSNPTTTTIELLSVDLSDDDSSTVRYQPGGASSNVVRQLEAAEGSSLTQGKQMHNVGDTVNVSAIGSDKMYIAKVTRLHSDHSLCVCYEDHNEEVVSLDRIHPIQNTVSHHGLTRVLSGNLKQLSKFFSANSTSESANVAVDSEGGDSSSTEIIAEETEDGVVTELTTKTDEQDRHIMAPTGDEFGNRAELFDLYPTFADLLMATEDDDDRELALQMYALASECCVELGKPKLAMKYAMLAES